MRIRKRALKLPLSLLSPVALQPSDLQLVQLKAYGDDDKKEDQREEEISNIPSKKGDSGAIAVADNGVFPSPSPPSSQEKVALAGRWCDGDKAIPLKKRKASLELNNFVVSGEESSSSKMKSKTNKKCTLLTTFDEEEEEEEEDDDDYSLDHDSDSISTDDNKKKKKKKKKSKKKGGSIMEGSRCSRVNGRGWRCMQPTLVGYSLCEHHLGKGRLRSISSSVATPHNVGEKLGSNNKRKRMRVGMVKARSLSSLLCQPNTPVVHLGSSN